MLAPLIADPLHLTREIMEAWALDFDCWSTCDNACIHCFRKSPFAFDCAHAWVRHQETFVKRAGFVLGLLSEILEYRRSRVEASRTGIAHDLEALRRSDLDPALAAFIEPLVGTRLG